MSDKRDESDNEQLRIQWRIAQRERWINVAPSPSVETQLRWIREEHYEATVKLKEHHEAIAKMERYGKLMIVVCILVIAGSITWVALLSERACQ